MDKARFLENLTKERKIRSLTQKELADALGISDKTYSKWETGENEPDVETLCRLAAFYGVSPAVFFRSDGDESELEGMGAAEAAQTCWRRTIDLLMGLRSAEYPPQDAPPKELPAPEAPRELRMPEVERSVWEYGWRDQMAVVAAGPDANLAMLMLPHAERYRWLKTAGIKMEELFRVLGMPGATKCLYAMLTEKPGNCFTAGYLAEKAGVTAEEASAFLEAAVPWQLCSNNRFYREEGPGLIYSSLARPHLMGLLTLAFTLIPTEAGPSSRGHIFSGSGMVNLYLSEKGGAE